MRESTKNVGVFGEALGRGEQQAGVLGRFREEALVGLEPKGMAASTSSGSSSLVNVLPPEASMLPILLMATRLIEQPQSRTSAPHTAAFFTSIVMDSSLVSCTFPWAISSCPYSRQVLTFRCGDGSKKMGAVVAAERLPLQRLDLSFKVLVPLSFEAAFGFQRRSTRSRRPAAPA